MKSIMFILLTNITFCYSTSLYYATIVEILLSNNDCQLTYTQEQNIDFIATEIYVMPDILYPNIGLNTLNKEKIRRFLSKHEFLVRKIINNVNTHDHLQPITWAFLSLYTTKALKKKNNSNLLIDAQDMYNILHHLYTYSRRVQSKF